jgi:phage I-like protein
MRQRFPDYFEKDSDDVQVSVSPQRTPNTVVASASRNNGAKPRKIQLTATQVSVAKRLGLTPEQYAKQLIKESYNG